MTTEADDGDHEDGGRRPTEEAAEGGAPRRTETSWKLNLVLFLATVGSVFFTAIRLYADAPEAKDAGILDAFRWELAGQTSASLQKGAEFTGALLAILVAHELGHWIAARIHGVDASLPFFLPLPILSPFGTMGAVIRMRGVIPTRRALFDIGAAGPLAGLTVALPIYAWGVARSHVVPSGGEGMGELGESLLVRALDHAFGPHVPDGMTMMYSPAAYGAWGGLFVTMINLLPVGQLDGGHVAYALFGAKQDRYAKVVHRAMLAFFGVAIVGHLGRDVAAARPITASLVSAHVANALFWFVWFQMLAVLGSLAARARNGPRVPDTDAGSRHLTLRTRAVATLGLLALASWRSSSWLVVGVFFASLGLLLAMEVHGGVLRDHDLLDHPPTSAEGLDPIRKVLAIATLVLFALLFMPEPFSF